MCIPWSQCRVEECVLAGGGLEMSGWADREHSRCRCPSPYHSARLTHTDRTCSVLIYLYAKEWISSFPKMSNCSFNRFQYQIFPTEMITTVLPGLWCWTLIDSCRTNSNGSLTTSCRQNENTHLSQVCEQNMSITLSILYVYQSSLHYGGDNVQRRLW